MFTILQLASNQTLLLVLLLLVSLLVLEHIIVNAVTSANDLDVYQVEGVIPTGEMITVDGLDKDTI